MNTQNENDFKAIEAFVKELCDFNLPQELGPELSCRAENFYADAAAVGTVQAKNLALYLHRMSDLNPRWLLVGEAPGCHGCRWSGIPFTSEDLLVKNSFLSDGAFSVRDRGNPERDASATAVWKYLAEREFYPLMWNAYPFHPHGEGNVNSNRSPTGRELEVGRKFLQELIGIFGIKNENIIAVGRAAEKSLTRFDFLKSASRSFKEVRHPSYGGQKEFCKGLDELLGQ